MNPIRNPSIIRDYNHITDNKLSENLESLNNQLVPIIDIKPFINIVKGASSGTIYTTPTDKDFYLVAVIHNVAHSGADTGTVNQVRAYIENIQTAISRIGGVNAEADKQTIQMNFGEKGIKLTRGTAIDINVTGTWSTTYAIIFGYTRETLTAQ